MSYATFLIPGIGGRGGELAVSGLQQDGQHIRDLSQVRAQGKQIPREVWGMSYLFHPFLGDFVEPC